MSFRLPPALDEVIDWEMAEELLLQHDRYEIGHIAVVRLPHPRKWVVYYRSLAVDALENPTAEPRLYDEFTEALTVAVSPASHERWDALWAERRKPK